ncbi:phosphate signaling complex protein PhoU [Gluconacetobacter entanii]|uniref:Phosphate-specific transport system accessory protein PhoU n=2 Tax=Acetobacteraceae TaxID=433 RepID=A0A318QA32_9PROT|nr:phosphate signaling complex protein PhoU [Gluconacetobacter entanii]MBE7618455.1 phosphate signaling complex protein PhoU [Komagataeibacter sp. FXV2]MCE2578861.1 phosphate signaling complex protein PhoU [Komagataeibacter sp. FNDCR1]MBY4640822.1 phosphate signaling complex protein PhoU [Gluconacetobacter entanii]MCW4581660.1 phosphate signaling complex protein PhoU [Gluconacetobacter entanii]MCW4584919.1 phosphate signaling complex protein PhoU [Gluconacetobacter entanii]
MGQESTHIVSSFEQELERLRAMMVRMGGLVERQTSQAVAAVVDHDENAAAAAPELDPQVDVLERDVEAMVIRILALRSPVAGDLREVVSALKITGDMERIGDCAASVARRSLRTELLGTRVSLSGLRGMGRLVQDNLRRAIDAMTQRDPEKAYEVWQSDTAVDELYTAMFRELVTYMMEDPRNIGPCTHLLFIAKNLERIGDHATNIAERVYYTVTGDILPVVRPRGGFSGTAATPDDAVREELAKNGVGGDDAP